MEAQTKVLCACGCGRPAPIAGTTMKARGWVKGQPQRYVRGHSNRNRTTLRERFEAKVDRTPGLGPKGACHEWTAALGSSGYGTMGVPEASGRRMVPAHRVAWYLAHGAWPARLVLHRCDNRRCVRADHLFLGTHKENMADMVAKGRQARGAAHPAAKLTVEQVAEIRALAGSETMAATGRRFGVTLQAVSRIQSGKGWAD